MKIELEINSLAEIKSEVLIVPIFQEDNLSHPLLAELNQLSNGVLALLLESGELKTKKTEISYLYIGKQANISRLILVGAGESTKVTSQLLGQLAATVIRFMVSKKLASAVMLVRNPSNLASNLLARHITEAVLLAPYEQNKYQKKEEEDFQISSLALAFEHTIDKPLFDEAVLRGTIVAEAANFARDLILEPANKLTPKEFARRAGEMANSLGLEFNAIDEEELKKLGMGALLAVSQGSDEPAQLIVLRYRASKSTDNSPIALVGKGITFDSGGICIKPREGMWEMKTDMSGGAAVVGTMAAIAKLKPNVDVLGVVAASENLPSGKAYKPGDVITAYSGKTIEVIDTDAEGRIVLADALHYANQQKPSCIIDLATLTGACIIALGNCRAGMMGSDDKLMNELRQASEQAGEKLWQLPLTKEYQDMIKSDIADIKNLGGRYAGAITAAAFLRAFVGDTPWAHLDIAGTAWQEEDQPEMAKGPTGYGVRTLVEFILSRSQKN
ncbi:MAG: leucyl aminopeptidase [Blastocatellia bacterium]|nr:leucyl aminopeptidase [Blastocatellia bacterium]